LVEKLAQVFKPITKPSNRNQVITFDSHLKTALMEGNIIALTAASTLLPHKSIIPDE